MTLLRGFVIILGLSSPGFAQYAGPAILSRGEAPAAMSAPSVTFSFSASAVGYYSNGLVGIVTPNAQGQLPSSSSFGAGLTLGVSGAHSWKHTHLGMNYSGSFYDYFQAGSYSGLSQGLSLGITHQFSRHIGGTVRESAGTYTLFPPSTVALNSAVPFDPSQSAIPTTDFYNNRTIYTSTQGDLTFQASNRLSFDFGGAYFANLQGSSALYSAKGEAGTADAQYRLSRRTTVGAVYSYTHYGYSGSLGGATIYTTGLSVSMRLSRWTEFSFFGGAAHVNSSFEQNVPINPAILAILCPPSLISSCPLTGATVINNNTLWAPDFGLRFSRSFRRGVAYLTGGESITPGNGLFLTSRAVSGTVGYGYSGLRKWSLNIGAFYVRALSLGNIQGNYGQVTGSYGMSRQLVGALSFVSSFAATQYQSPSFNAYNRLIYSASVGLGWSSKGIPIRFF